MLTIVLEVQHVYHCDYPKDINIIKNTGYEMHLIYLILSR